MNNRGRSSVRTAAQTVAGTHRIAVSAMRKRLSPSMPSCQRMPSSEIQLASVT